VIADYERQAGCMQSQRSSIDWPFSLQCSLQYFPCGPCFSTVQLQAGCAHLVVSAIRASLSAF